MYANVLAEIEYTGIASPVKDIFVLTVWKTDELYESNLRLAESINQFSYETDELIRRSNEILGEAIEPDTSDSELLEPSSRDEFTNREYCVTQLRKPS